MNVEELKNEIANNGDNQQSLANAMGLSRTRLNAKINGRNGASFNQPEIVFICKRYHFTRQRLIEVFFGQTVS